MLCMSLETLRSSQNLETPVFSWPEELTDFGKQNLLEVPNNPSMSQEQAKHQRNWAPYACDVNWLTTKTWQYFCVSMEWLQVKHKTRKHLGCTYCPLLPGNAQKLARLHLTRVKKNARKRHEGFQIYEVQLTFTPFASDCVMAEALFTKYSYVAWNN